MSNCFTCQKGFSGSENDMINYYKKLYNEKGVITYAYKLSQKGGVFFASKQSFLTIFERKIKDNLENGATYARIDEFRQD